jgi:hypothetical protein
MSTAISADSSYITHSPNVCGGQPVIAGTRTPVKSDVQLQFAAEHDRALLTFSTTHYLNLHQVWLQADKKHAGIIVSDQLPIGEIIRRLLNLLNRVTADEIRNQLYWLQNFK